MAKRMFVAVAGEEFTIHVPGPEVNMADPCGFIGGRCFEFKVAEDRNDIIRVENFKEKGYGCPTLLSLATNIIITTSSDG
jgi:hypothetical protein